MSCSLSTTQTWTARFSRWASDTKRGVTTLIPYHTSGTCRTSKRGRNHAERRRCPAPQKRAMSRRDAPQGPPSHALPCGALPL